MLMQLSAVGEQLGSAQEAPVRTQELQAPNAKLLPSEHELHETAAQLKAAELDITSQQQLLSTLLRSVSEGVVIVDCSGQVLMENEAAIRIVGYSARLVGAKRWCEAIGAYLVDGDRPLPPEDMPTMRACRGGVGAAHQRLFYIAWPRRRNSFRPGRVRNCFPMKSGAAAVNSYSERRQRKH